MAEEETKAWICTACGYIHDGDEPPDKCPVCAVGADCFVPHVETEVSSTEDDIVLEEIILEDEDDS